MKAQLLFIIIVSLLAACTSHTAKNDADTVTPDGDAPVVDDIIEIEVDDVVFDEDAVVIPDNALTDFDYAGVDCAAWVPNGDPYANEESAAMKWYGDFDVVAKDPDNIRKLWEGIYRPSTDKPDPRLVKPYDRCSKDYPFEAAVVEDENNFPDTLCNNSNVRDTIKSFSCDTLITPGRCWGMSWVMGWDPLWSENNGKVMVDLFNPNNTYFLQGQGGYYFDIASRRMVRLTGMLDDITALNGRYVFFSTYDNAKQSNWPDKPKYYQSNSAIRTLAYYDTLNNEYGIAYKAGMRGYFSDLRANDRYLVATIQDDLNQEPIHVEYTKIGEWDNWKPLKAHDDPSLDRIGAPSLYDHYVAFYNWDFVIKYCDLEIGTDSCKVVSRHAPGGTISARHPVISGDGKRIYYDEMKGDGLQKRDTIIVEADITDLAHIVYREITQHDKALLVQDIDERYLAYVKETGIDTVTTNEYPFYVACYYRFADGKNICLENEHDSDTSADVNKVNTKLWDKYLVYGESGGLLILRDMECYCKAYPDTCPYEEFSSKRSKKK